MPRTTQGTRGSEMSETNLDEAPGPAAPPQGRGATIRRWIVQGARSAVFLRPDWTGLRGTPLLLAWACVANVAVLIAPHAPAHRGPGGLPLVPAGLRLAAGRPGRLGLLARRAAR